MPAIVERFWCSRRDDYLLDDHGFLLDPDMKWWGSESANPRVLRTQDLSEHRCLVMLGEPGMGKSTAARDANQLVNNGVPVTLFDLASYGSEDRLVRDVFEGRAIAEWSAGTGDLCVVLDSLDEAQNRLPHIGSLIASSVRKLPCDRLFLRVVCRTGEWPDGLERSLAEVFGSVEVVEILPLRRADAGEIAVDWGAPEAFLHEAEKAGAGPLASRPLTLRFLAREFAQSGSFPGRGADLYRAGVRSMCEEQNPSRRDAGINGQLSLDERVAVLRRIAAATVFGGSSAIWTGPEVDADTDDLILDRITGSTEPTSGGPTPVSMSAVREAARLGLFASRGGQRLGWAHATFADFLAAEWVIVNNLSCEQARPLFLGPDGRCWPQTRLAASWAVAADPNRFAFLIEADPEAFQGEVELPGDLLRSAVIEGLFSVAGTLTTRPWDRSYAALRHPEIADQLRPRLTDSDPDVRRLALELADECASIELTDDLVDIVSDVTAGLRDRISAGWTLARLSGTQRTSALRSLAMTLQGGDDAADDLRGVCLLASWPHALSAAEVFSVLSRRSRRSHRGAYATFIDTFAGEITTADTEAAMAWLVNDLEGPSNDDVLGALANRVMVLASQEPNPAVVEAFCQVVLARAAHYDGLMFETLGDHQQADPLANDALRRDVAARVLAAEQTDHLLHQLPERGAHSLGIVRADDFGWLVDLYHSSAVGVQGAVRKLFGWIFDVRRPDHRDFLLSMEDGNPLRTELAQQWIDPVVLDSPTADQMRRSWRMVNGPKPIEPEKNDGVEAEIITLLDRFDQGESAGFWYSARLLTVAPGSKHFRDEFDPDLSSMPRWSALSETVRARIVDSAHRYLCLHPCETAPWLDNSETIYYPAEAGYRALILLLRVAPERLHDLPATVWTEWAPVLATTSTGMVNGAKWEDKLALLELAGAAPRGAMRELLLARVDAAVSEGKSPYLENEAGYLWDDGIASHYLRLARLAATGPRDELVASLSKHNFGIVLPLLLEWLSDGTDGERQRLAARHLIDRDLEQSWPALRVVFDDDIELAQDALGNALTIRGYERIDTLPPALVADIYLWLRENFPPETDPEFDDAHMVGAREEVGQWRDKLLGQLRDQGTQEAVAEIRRIRLALPDRWLAMTLASAEINLRRNQWSPIAFEHLLQLAVDRRSRLVSDGATLAAATTEALSEVQIRLVGATPESHYLWDSHSGRPKSEDEISDYVANELERSLLTSGAIVNREVQVRRNGQSGIGERTDLLVDAATVTGSVGRRLSLPIEVKGAWNDELLTAVRNQLVDRYMHDVAAAEGIYVVAWPDLTSWTDTTDTRRRVVAGLDRSAVESELATQAADLEAQGVAVHVVHLDISYRRPA